MLIISDQYHPDIVVVSENRNQSSEDSLGVNKLDYVPLFYPILKNSIGVKEDQTLYEINPNSVTLQFGLREFLIQLQRFLIFCILILIDGSASRSSQNTSQFVRIQCYQRSRRHTNRNKKGRRSNLLILDSILLYDRRCFHYLFSKLHLVIDIMLQNFVEKQRRYAKYCEQFKTVSDLSQSLRKIQRSMDEIVPMMKEINECLPENERLEEFTFR